MPALGHKQTLPHARVMSALPPKADIEWRLCDVCFVPKADIRRQDNAGSKTTQAARDSGDNPGFEER
jgi:hypothetical protein